ncbi:NAD(P)/FAD-dependent oxidoreductase [Sulfitobacter sp.]|jgi:glycine oxidase|uniref:NAD(P)/FAD-dependent oxidoreductase n=1 Tax=Sulfitobacter sp. TaxID=1903071 RepID=UPI000C0E9F70|nr:FAD-dependent oxidoreductase [Roseobacter sp.]MBV49402.1 FAD-dependent oxidoreductase [Roseobacter sp.]PHR09905.1 MAG: FAD-dependent oxidoreductase [Sulfitobacter sp.]|tara:strand:- start:4106 stop:5137 length:1032 start_codon:yes stop_codon:yes gene_type:complete
MADITIRGAGIFGLSVAWACVKRGAAVKIIDPNGPASGSSGGIVGALAPHVPENWNAKKAFQLESLLMAEDFWANVESTGGGRSGYARNGRLQPIADGHALVLAQRRADTARALWQQNATWEIVPATDTPWEPASPSGWIIRDSLSGLIHPKGACMALVQALAVKGVRVDAEGPDLGQVLWATGVAGLLDMTANHSRAVGNGVKGQAALLAYDARGLPQLFAGGVHVIPHGDGTVAVGSTSERDYTSPNLTDTQLDDVISAARSAVPALDDAPVIARWAGVRPRSRSRAPMLGPWPGKSGHFIANGGFKIGFGMAPKIAEVMADLMLEARDTIPDGFRIEDNF